MNVRSAALLRGGTLGLCLLGLCLLAAPDARAHEVRPAYLQIDETEPGVYELLWRTPELSGRPLPVVLQLPEGTRDVVAPKRERLGGSRVERRIIELTGDPDGGLVGRRIGFPGLQATITDILVRVTLLDGRSTGTIVRPAQPWVYVEPSPGRGDVLRVYLTEGVRHILFGWDHLLFVLALVLLVHDRRTLLVTITAFTVAHSITLALATLDVVHVPGPPVEAVIALSIVLLAYELVRQSRAQSGLTERWPWSVAFAFGLLHGFGFAGALAAMGLPHDEVPLALFAFNVGVELGQLAFIAAVLTTVAIARRLPLPAVVARGALPATVYSIGSLAALWFIERVAAF